MTSRFIGCRFLLGFIIIPTFHYSTRICPALQAQDFLQRADGQHGGLLARERNQAL